MGLQLQQSVVNGRRLDSLAHEWWAVQVWAGREQRSAEQLRARGYEIFLPCYQERRRWSDRVKTIERALFAGYVFCRIVSPVAAKIVTTPGVIRIVGDGSGPLAVRSDEIEAIQRIVATQRSAEPWPYVQVGEYVRIEAGPLRGTEGIVQKVSNRYRLVVSVSLLQRSVSVEVDPEWVTTAHRIGDRVIGLQAS
jgi:transcription antitermination factor NusG